MMDNGLMEANMRCFFLTALTVLFVSCSWLSSHPQVKKDLEKIGETVGEEILTDIGQEISGLNAGSK